MALFVQVVNDGTPGALYEVGSDSFEDANELALKVLAAGKNTNGPVEITDEVRDFIETDGYYEEGSVGVYVVSSEVFSEDEDDEDEEQRRDEKRGLYPEHEDPAN